MIYPPTSLRALCIMMCHDVQSQRIMWVLMGVTDRQFVGVLLTLIACYYDGIFILISMYSITNKERK